MSTNRDKYRALCSQELRIPLFSQAWWLDAVAGDAWDVALLEQEGVIVASLPYVTRMRFGLRLIGQPILTPHLGPWLRSGEARSARRLAKEKNLLQGLYQSLPAYAQYKQNWYCERNNWLPLYWLGYEQSTRYTYRIEQLDDLEAIWSGFDTNIRTDIRKAEKKFAVKVRTDCSFESFLALNKKVFDRQSLQVPYSSEVALGIHAAAMAQNACKLFVAVDDQGREHAGVFILWDSNSAYYLLGGGDPDLRNSGATSLCMWHAIQFAATVTRKFDFEGSMIEPVERFFRGFGATQAPYSVISKTNSRVIRTLQFIRTIKAG
ncbi:GNAT family N-acetyltransferase [Pseudomonas mosselii]|uniref:GNAT family N-acetyltransferase n=1 Tax=Pseudomonas mosselii TaxID=78327 RepID=UPI0007816D8A|nr:GNAT family N-acetyltransferase [Pseudomonas mosselii]KXG81456.1 methicillin resistance protein [Pseudomonas mosselii]MCH7418393.1 GNAT family N-acetyltransferase [Pseudomonas mosselii]